MLVDHWYIEPHGCTGGDYWKEGEWRFVCPTTHRLNRIMFDDWGLPYEQRDTYAAAGPMFKVVYRSLSGSRRDVYDGHERGCSKSYDCGCVGTQPGFNNYYVDAHRARFELPAKPKAS